MNLKEKYGEWALVLGATEGVGKAFCLKLASEGMSLVMVGRRTGMLRDLAGAIQRDYDVACRVVPEDLAVEGAIERVIKATEGLDIGFMTYVACLSPFGAFHTVPLEVHQKALNTNVIAFLKAFHHYSNVFVARGRGAIINVSSCVGNAGAPYLAEYSACKAYITKLTQSVSDELKDFGVDVLAIILGATLTPTFLAALPGGPDGEIMVKNAMKPSDCIDEAFEHLGKNYSWIAGENNRANEEKWRGKTADERVAYAGSFYRK